MAYSKVYSAELEGIDARLIEVETDINVGLHNFTIVGLADKALSEAKERVNSALKNIGVKAPNRENRRITVNLAPADVKKNGSHYDLAIAVGYLRATEQVKDFDEKKFLFIGELSLEGKLRRVSGCLNMARLAKSAGFRELIVPAENAAEAAIVRGISIIPAKDVSEVIHHLEEKATLKSHPETDLSEELGAIPVDFRDIRGQATAKRALTVSAAGGHNLIMIGTPGAGKSMLASALASILPPMNLEEIIETTQIWSAAGFLHDRPFISRRPFRSPHHTASPVSIIGGGGNPRPGEVSLSHRGVLFLDELPEFRRDLLEALRQPMEAGQVHISRVKNTLIFPAKFTLVAAMNPCPCGYYRDDEKPCRCTANEVFRYQKKVSGPLLDRIDLQINVPRIKTEELTSDKSDTENSFSIRERIKKTRAIQRERYQKLGQNIFTNSEISSRQCEELIELELDAKKLLENNLKDNHLSARGYYRLLKTARTIADLESSSKVSAQNILEAFSYRLREE